MLAKIWKALALAGDQDGIAGTGVGQRNLDRVAAIGLDPDPTRSAKAREQVVEDLVGVFGPGAIDGQDDVVGAGLGGPGERQPDRAPLGAPRHQSRSGSCPR